MTDTKIDIVLHLGAHRCGTTTLQHVLHLNRGRLLAKGTTVWTPAQTRHGWFAGLLRGTDGVPPGPNGSAIGPSHCPSLGPPQGPPQRPSQTPSLRHPYRSPDGPVVGPGVSPLVARRDKRALGLIGIELARLARAGSRTLLISEADLIGSVVGNLRRASLYADLSARLARFAPRLAPRCIRIGLTVRAFDTFWASTLGFGIGHGRPMPGPAALAALCAQPRRWRHVVEDVAAAFPGADLIVWPFERFVSRPEVPLAHLLDTPDIGDRFVGRESWRNASPTRDKLRRLLALRGEAAIGGDLQPGDGRWMPFDAAQQRQLQRAYAVDIAWLRGGAGGVAQFVETPLRRADMPQGCPSTDPLGGLSPDNARNLCA